MWDSKWCFVYSGKMQQNKTFSIPFTKYLFTCFNLHAIHMHPHTSTRIHIHPHASNCIHMHPHSSTCRNGDQCHSERGSQPLYSCFLQDSVLRIPVLIPSLQPSCYYWILSWMQHLTLFLRLQLNEIPPLCRVTQILK